jgi:hypothetical protein
MGKNMHTEKMENINYRPMLGPGIPKSKVRLDELTEALRIAGKPFIVVYSTRSTNNNGEVLDAEVVWGESPVDKLLQYFIPDNSGAQGPPPPVGVLVEPDDNGKMRPVPADQLRNLKPGDYV